MTGPGRIVNNIAHLRPDWISVDVAQQFQKMTVFFDKNTLVPPAKQLPVYIPATVIALGIHAVYVPHSPGQVAGRCLSENMIVI